jgi:hypothetical protein
MGASAREQVTVTATATTGASLTAASATAAATTSPSAQQSSTQKTQPVLRPGPHSAVADIDLPVGTIACATFACGDSTSPPDADHESWRYTAPRQELVRFLQEQFANGPVYDGYGATSWMGLPPCYGTNHQSPPLGERGSTGTSWKWSGQFSSLVVFVNEVGALNAVGEVITDPMIMINRISSPLDSCLRG